MNYANENVGMPTDPPAPVGDGTVIAIMKANRALLTTLVAGVVISGVVIVGGRLSTAPAEATAAAPVHSEGDNVPLSTNLTGRLRTSTSVDTLLATNPVTSGANDFIALSANAVPVREVFNEDLNGIYSFTIQEVVGINAAQNFLCLFNLGASTDTAIVLLAQVGRWSNAAANTNNSIILFRVTACTGGTLQATTAINEFANSFSSATMEVRTANPTTTNAAAVFAWAPSQAISATGSTGGNDQIYVLPFRMLLAPGEGVVFRQTLVGDIDQRYNFTIVWGERN